MCLWVKGMEHGVLEFRRRLNRELVVCLIPSLIPNAVICTVKYRLCSLLIGIVKSLSTYSLADLTSSYRVPLLTPSLSLYSVWGCWPASKMSQ